MGFINSKLIRRFKDTNDNFYEIRQKNNGHYFLLIKENEKKYAKIIEGNKYKIFNTLKEIHLKTKFIEIKEN